MTRLVLHLTPDGKRSPVPLAVFVRSLLKALLRAGGWKCTQVDWEEHGNEGLELGNHNAQPTGFQPERLAPACDPKNRDARQCEVTQ